MHGALDQGTQDAASEAIRSHTQRARPLIPFIGPAVLAAVAYIDPGNFATNLQAGASEGYALLWVVLWANLMAMLIQTLSAKLGIATGKNLAQIIRNQWPRALTRFYWVQAEIVAIFTDLAEFLGAALGFHLLAGFSMPVSAVLTLASVLLILALQKRGFRPLELLVGTMVAVVAMSFAVILFSSPVHWGEALRGTLLPSLGVGGQGLYLAVGILGATVMPHVIYLHSGLMQKRFVVSDQDKPGLMGQTRREVALVMGLAGLINMAMLALAAVVFSGRSDLAANITSAWTSLTPLLGPLAASLFAVALLASGISSSVVGTLSGQIVMQGFVRVSIPLWIRRLATSLPAAIVIALGVNEIHALVFSQVVLSFGIPLALVPLIIFTSRRDLMGALTNTRSVVIAGWSVTAVIVLLNMWLLYELVTSGS